MTKQIIIIGAKGRMGSRIIALLKQASDLLLKAGIDIDDDLEAIVDGADAIIDFSRPDVSVHSAKIAAAHHMPLVVGTTGLSTAQEQELAHAAQKTAIVYAPNMSVGVNLMWKLSEIAARILGEDYLIDIEETHHVHKLDRPSGTAKKLLDVIAKAHHADVKDIIAIEDDPSWQRREGEKRISMHSIRKGEVVGDHTITFTGPQERLTIEHHAEDRDVFASGALTAARWVIGKPAGLYGMDDVLGLSSAEHELSR